MSAASSPTLVFLLAAAATFGLRAVMTVGGAGLLDRPTVRRSITLAGPAVLSAMVVSAVLGGHGGSTTGLAEVGALVAAVVAVRLRGNASIALLVGMPVYWFLGWFLG